MLFAYYSRSSKEIVLIYYDTIWKIFKWIVFFVDSRHLYLHNYSYIWRSVLGVHWKDWCWSWNSNTLATSCKELTHWKRPWCWEGFGAGGECDDRRWDGWMASQTQWTWVWVNSGSLWWTGRPGVLRFMGSQRVVHNWATELNWTDKHLWQSIQYRTLQLPKGI